MFLSVIISLVILLTGCESGKSDADFYKDLEEQLEKVSDHQQTVFDKLLSESTYSLKFTIESEKLANFDAENKKMPSNFDVPENNKMERTTIEISYTQNRDAFEFSFRRVSSKLDDNGMPLFNDDAFKENIYKEPFVLEYDSTVDRVRVADGDVVIYEGVPTADYEIDIGLGVQVSEPYVKNGILNTLIEYTKTSGRSVFSANRVNWFGSVISSHTNYSIKTNSNDDYQAYRDNENASGRGEDLIFDWENITSVRSVIISATSKKDKLEQLELYTDIFATNIKITDQIWNGERVTSYIGDLIESSSCIIDISYP
jgi:hypothetical protein